MTCVEGSAYYWQRYQTGLLEAAALYTCSQCNAPSIGLVYADSNHYRADLIMNNLDVEPRWIPEAGSGKDYPEVPPTIASTADEAHRCYSIKAYRGAIALARAALEATAKDKGYTKGGLQQKIKDMTDDRLLRSNIGRPLTNCGMQATGYFTPMISKRKTRGDPTTWMPKTRCGYSMRCCWRSTSPQPGWL
jgi:hypothetical protein